MLRCIEDKSDERLNAKEVSDWLQKAEMIKIESKRTIALPRGPNQYPALKIITLGEAGTGKTSIIKRFVNNCFNDRVMPTVGFDFYSKKINVYGVEFSLYVTDTVGLETFSKLPRHYLRGAVGALLVFDITNRRSFKEGVPDMLKLIDGDDTDDMRVILVGNKVDKEDRRKVTRKEAEEFAANLGVLYFETSAVTGQNIQKVFEEITKVIYITSALTNPTVENAPASLHGSLTLHTLHTMNTMNTSSWCSWC